MRLRNITVSAAMSIRELARNRLILVLAALVPLLFFAVATASTNDTPVPVKLARAPTADLVAVSERDQSLIFLGVAGVALMGAFFGANLVQRRVASNKRLVLCGYRSTELIAAKLVVLVVIIVTCALYTLALLTALIDLERPLGVLLGLALAAFVYGAYGLCIGSIFRRDLETVFAILILINIDAGWLQNPAYYLNARSPWLVEALPAHLPTQTAMLAALTPHPITTAASLALLYGGLFLSIALIAYAMRMRVAR